MNTSKSLDAYHLHSCHSRQAWVKGMDKPFPCDCGLEAAIVEAVEGVYGDSDGLREFASTGSNQVDTLLLAFVKHFAFQDDEGNWWGMDTNLGKQEEAFNKAKQAVKELL